MLAMLLQGTSHENETLYEIVSKSKFFTKLFDYIKDDKELVDIFNSTSHNITVFAPTNKAIENLEKWKHDGKFSKEKVRDAVLYHVAPGLYPVKALLAYNTIPSLLKSSTLDNESQRLRINIGLKGFYVNLFARVVYVNVVAENGILHAIDHVILPPPKIANILQVTPNHFSTLVNGLYKTGVIEELKKIEEGLTLFAPTNNAFERLGSRAIAFLFSDHGKKYLAALLKYHIAPGRVLYSDVLIKTDTAEKSIASPNHGRIPKGHYHVELKTLLEDHDLSVDIGRFGRLIDFTINRYTRAVFTDGVAADGVIHVVGNVILPPKKLAEGITEYIEGEVEPEQLMELLEPYL